MVVVGRIRIDALAFVDKFLYIVMQANFAFSIALYTTISLVALFVVIFIDGLLSTNFISVRPFVFASKGVSAFASEYALIHGELMVSLGNNTFIAIITDLSMLRRGGIPMRLVMCAGAFCERGNAGKNHAQNQNESKNFLHCLQFILSYNSLSF